jgi:hypothetical protein
MPEGVGLKDERPTSNEKQISNTEYSITPWHDFFSADLKLKESYFSDHKPASSTLPFNIGS